MGQPSQRAGGVAGARPLVIGKVYVLGQRYFLALLLRPGERLVSLRGGKARVIAPDPKAKEVKSNEPSVQDLCACWGIELDRLDAYVARAVYAWRPERQDSLGRGVGAAWRGAASLGPGESRGRVMGLDPDW